MRDGRSGEGEWVRNGGGGVGEGEGWMWWVELRMMVERRGGEDD